MPLIYLWLHINLEENASCLMEYIALLRYNFHHLFITKIQSDKKALYVC